MHKYFFQNWRAAMLFMIAAATSGSAMPQRELSDPNGPSEFLLTISAADRTVKTGSPVWVDATVKNISDKVLPFGKESPTKSDQGGRTYKVDVVDESGTRRPETLFYRRILGHLTPEERAHYEPGPRSAFHLLLGPGETTTDRVDVGRLYDLGRPGKYTIQFLLPGVSVRSNRITVTVTR